METIDKNLEKANNWLYVNPSFRHDVKTIAKKMRELSDSIHKENLDNRDAVQKFESSVNLVGIGFREMTKSQQLEIINETGRHGPCYDSFISSAAFQIFTLAKAGCEDVERICKDFTGEDLARISRFLEVFGNQKTRAFNRSFDEIKDRVVQEEQNQGLGSN